MTAVGFAAAGKAAMKILLILGALLVASPARAQFGGLTWTFKGSQSGLQTANTLKVTGPDGDYPPFSMGCYPGGAVGWFETIAPVDGQILVSLWFGSDDSVGFDAPIWLLDGVKHFPDGWLGYPGDYTFVCDVLAGQKFGLGVWSYDCIGGPGVAHFFHIEVLPDTWYPMGDPIDPQIGSLHGGKWVDGAGDIDGDGVADLVVGWQDAADKVRVLSGASGAALFAKGGLESLGASVAGAGDFDGDGTPDFIAGAPTPGLAQPGKVIVWSGQDGSELLQWDGVMPQQVVGKAIDGVGDVDGDGLDDVAVSVAALVNTVVVLGGSDGHVIHQLATGSFNDDFGASIAGIGDADLDGVPDILVGAPATSSIFAAMGRANLFSGATGAPLLSPFGPNGFAQAVSAAGDIDGDGRADFGVADPYYNNSNGEQIGRVAAFSGLDGELLVQGKGASGSPIGATVSGGADLTGDGVPDLVTARSAPGISLLVISGADGAVVKDVPVAATAVVREVALVGDVDASGVADTAIVWDSSIRIVKALEGPGAPQLEGSGHIAGNKPVALAIDHARPGAQALLVLGSYGVQLPLLGGVLQPAPEILAPLAIDAAGAVQVEGQWPPGLPAGTSIWLQAWIVDPAGPQGWTCTNGLVAVQLDD